MDDNSNRAPCPIHRHLNSIFQVSNPSASDDHDHHTEFDLAPPSPPGSQCHCYQVPLPRLVIDEKRWRRRFFRSDARRSGAGVALDGTLRDQRKRKSISPPQYTSGGFIYPEEEEEGEAEEEEFSQEEDEEMQEIAPHRMITIPARTLPNPHPYSETRTRSCHPHPQPPKDPSPAKPYVPNEVAAYRPSVVFADVRPLSITRRKFSRHAHHVQVDRHSHFPPRTTTHESYPRRHSDMQRRPYPTTPSISAAHRLGSSQEYANRLSQYQSWTRGTPELMGRSSSHDRSGGRSYTSSTLNNRRAAGAGAHRLEHSQETPPFSATRRYPPIRLAVHGLSYADEDAEGNFIGSEARWGEPHAPRQARRPPQLHPPIMAQLQSRSQQDLHSEGEPQPQTQPQQQGRPTKTKEIRQPRTTISHQPQHHPRMEAKPGGGNRNFKRMPYSDDGKRDWSTDLCLFCDHNLGTCCKALWCPCIIYGRNKARIEHLYAEDKVHPTRGGTCSDDCAIHACLTTFCLFGWAIQVPNRAFIRRRYNIEGDWLGDCAAALFCSPCELSQESREIDLEEGSLRDGTLWNKGQQNSS